MHDEQVAELRLMVSDLALICAYLAGELHRQKMLGPLAAAPISSAMEQLAGGLEPDDPDDQFELAETAAVLNSVALLLERDPPDACG